MEKAVVLEIREEYAAVLTVEGLVRKIRNENYAVGQEIELPDSAVQHIEDSHSVRRRFAGWYRAAAAAAAIAVVSCGSLYYATENVFAYSTVTVTTDETAVELTLNKKNEVVSAKALDEKSETAVSGLRVSVRNRKELSAALDAITEGKEQAEVSVSSKTEERRQALEKEVQALLPPAQQPGAVGSGQTEEPVNTDGFTGDTRDGGVGNPGYAGNERPEEGNGENTGGAVEIHGSGERQSDPVQGGDPGIGAGPEGESASTPAERNRTSDPGTSIFGAGNVRYGTGNTGESGSESYRGGADAQRTSTREDSPTDTRIDSEQESGTGPTEAGRPFGGSETNNGGEAGELPGSGWNGLGETGGSSGVPGDTGFGMAPQP